MKKLGRPKLPEGIAKDIVFPVRLSQFEREATEAAARVAGSRPSEWAREALLQAARDETSVEPAGVEPAGRGV